MVWISFVYSITLVSVYEEIHYLIKSLLNTYLKTKISERDSKLTLFEPWFKQVTSVLYLNIHNSRPSSLVFSFISFDNGGLFWFFSLLLGIPFSESVLLWTKNRFVRETRHSISRPGYPGCLQVFSRLRERGAGALPSKMGDPTTRVPSLWINAAPLSVLPLGLSKYLTLQG